MGLCGHGGSIGGSGGSRSLLRSLHAKPSHQPRNHGPPAQRVGSNRPWRFVWWVGQITSASAMPPKAIPTQGPIVSEKEWSAQFTGEKKFGSALLGVRSVLTGLWQQNMHRPADMKVPWVPTTPKNPRMSRMRLRWWTRPPPKWLHAGSRGRLGVG